MTAAELSVSFPAAFSDVLFASKRRKKHGTLRRYLDSQQITLDESELSRFRRHLETVIYEHVADVSYLQYALMRKSNDWGDAGQDQVDQAFCRVLLQLSPDTPVSYSHFQEFQALIDRELKARQLAGLSKSVLQARMRDFCFEVMGRRFDPYHTAEITQILQFVESDFFLQGGYYGSVQEYIFGMGKIRHFKGFDVIVFEHEKIRTPNTIMAMAAVIGDHSIFVRTEALKAIFELKWCHSTLYSPSFSMGFFPMEPSYELAEGLKSKTLLSFGIRSLSDARQKQDLFIADLQEIVLHHEIGHGIMQHSVLDAQSASLGEASRVFGENIFTAYLEIFADIAPKHRDRFGTLRFIAEVGLTDSERATRMFWMYFCDVWFFNTSDDYMYLYSELICMILLAFVREDGTLDFAKIRDELSFNRKRKTLLSSVVSAYTESIQGLRPLLEGMSYSLNGQTVSFAAFHRAVLKSCIQTVFKRTLHNFSSESADISKLHSAFLKSYREDSAFLGQGHSYLFLAFYWQEFFTLMKASSSGAAARKIKAYFNLAERRLFAEVVKCSLPKAWQRKTRRDMRDGIFERVRRYT